MGWKELFFTSVTGKKIVPHRLSNSMRVKGASVAAQICSEHNAVCNADQIELLYLKSRSRLKIYKTLNMACLILGFAIFLIPFIRPLMKQLIPNEYIRAVLLIPYFAFLCTGKVWNQYVYDYKMRRVMYKKILLEKRKEEFGDDIEGYKRYVDEMGDLLYIDEKTVIDPQIEYAFIGLISTKLPSDKQLEQVRYKLDGQKKVKKISAIAAAVLAVLSFISFFYCGKANFAVIWGFVFSAAFFIILIGMSRSSKKLREREEELECMIEEIQN